MGKTNLSPVQRAAMQHNSLIGLSVAIQKHAELIRSGVTIKEDARIVAETIKEQAKTLEQALRAGRKS